MAINIVEGLHRHAMDQPRVCGIDEIGGRSWTWSELQGSARACAAWLDQTTEPASVIMLSGPGGGAFWAAALGVLGSGRRLLPMPIETSRTERLAVAAAHNVAATVVTADDLGIEHAWVVQPIFDGGSGALDRADTGSLLLRSSGTTGNPSVALRSAAALDRVAETLVSTIELTQRDHVLAALPMHHAYGIEHAFLAPLLAGASVTWQSGFELSRSAAVLQETATVFPAVPVTLEAAARLDAANSALRLAYTAGSLLPEGVRLAFAEQWKVPVGDLYGATELGTIAFGVDGSMRAVAGVSIKISKEGEVLVLSDAMFEGYLDQAGGDLRLGDRIDGRFCTGDLGTLLDGELSITGRLKAQFDVGGLKVNPEDVEAVLLRCPGVQEVAVVPLVLSETVTRVGLMVVGEASTEAVRAFAKAWLATHLRPRRIERVAALPRTASGKIKRHELV